MADGGVLRTDLQLILSELKRKDRLLELKRRWLIGAPLSSTKQERLLTTGNLPESLLREDDIFYDTVKGFVEQKAFGVNRVERELKTSAKFLDLDSIEGVLLSCLDGLTSKGLYNLAVFLTEGELKVEKTRKKMRKVIIECFSGFVKDQKGKGGMVEVVSELSKILTDSENVRQEGSCCLHLLQLNAVAMEVLERLKELPTEALMAMRRKLRGVPAELPSLQKKRYGWSRDTLINKVKRTIKKMVSKLVSNGRRGFEVPLAKALAVAGLSLKLKRCTLSSMTEFMKFSPEMELLQTEIMKAVWLLETKVRMAELEALQELVDPSACVSKRSLRTAMKKLFTEYLFDCCDLGSIPKGFLKALNVINRSSRVSSDVFLLSDVIEEEAEYILSVSADIKQLVWDLIPGDGLAENFGDAYMEEPGKGEEEDDDDDDDDDVSTKQREPFDSPGFRFGSTYSENEEESIAEHKPFDCELDMPNSEQEAVSVSSAQNNRDISNLSPDMVLKDECVVKAEPSQSNADSPRDASDSRALNLCFGEGDSGPKDQTLPNNLYLDVQEASDETSLVAYNLIGHLLEGLALEERLDLDCMNGYLRADYSYRRDPGTNLPKEQAPGSIVVEVVEELIPSFPKSRLEKLKELMGT